MENNAFTQSQKKQLVDVRCVARVTTHIGFERDLALIDLVGLRFCDAADVMAQKMGDKTGFGVTIPTARRWWLAMDALIQAHSRMRGRWS